MTVNTQHATNYQSKDDPTCYAVNKNDYLHQIYIYDATRLGLSTPKFVAHVHDQNNKDTIIIAPKYDAKTDRLIITVDDKKPLCMSTIKYIEVQKL